MAEQLTLSFRGGKPLAVNRRAVRRFVARALRTCAAQPATQGFAVREHLETVALLEQVRSGVRAQARELKRQARRKGCRLQGRALIAYVCTPEGRRAQRWMEALRARIAEQEKALCV